MRNIPFPEIPVPENPRIQESYSKIQDPENCEKNPDCEIEIISDWIKISII